MKMTCRLHAVTLLDNTFTKVTVHSDQLEGVFQADTISQAAFLCRATRIPGPASGPLIRRKLGNIYEDLARERAKKRAVSSERTEDLMK